LLTGAIYDGLAKLLSPIPQQVNLSESGLSFHATEAITPGTHLHLAISHLEHHYHIAATARVVYCEDEDLEGFRTGAYFININPSDRARLSQDIFRKQEEHEALNRLKILNFNRSSTSFLSHTMRLGSNHCFIRCLLRPKNHANSLFY
jgi:hypothetical protein